MSGPNLPIEMSTEQSGQGPDTAAIVASLLLHRELIESCGMVYVIVDNRAPEEVEHWPAFAQWWSARRTLVGPQNERTDILWIQATNTNVFCTSGGAVCAGFAQVTSVELRASYKQGCKANRNNKQQPQQPNNQQNQTKKRQGNL